MADNAVSTPRWIVLGQVSGLYGVHGWVKLFSHTEPRLGIVGYDPLYLAVRGQWQPVTVQEARMQGKGVVAKFAGCDDRDAATALLGCELAVQRRQLPALAPGEYYWADLEGLRVVNLDGVELGTVRHVFATGANDVLVVAGERERLIPFVQGEVIVAIDFEQDLIRVDWAPTF